MTKQGPEGGKAKVAREALPLIATDSLCGKWWLSQSHAATVD